MAEYTTNRSTSFSRTDNPNAETRRIPSVFQIVTVEFVEEMIEELATGTNLSLTLPYSIHSPKVGSARDLLWTPITVSPNTANKPATITLLVEEPSGSNYEDGVAVSTQKLASTGQHPALRPGFWSMRSGDSDAGFYIEDIAVPQSSTSHTQYIGLATCMVPALSEQNPKTGQYEYTGERVVLGFKIEPTNVVLSGSDLTFELGGIMPYIDAAAGNQLDHAGRTAIVYKKSSPSATTGTAIPQGTLTFSSGTNRLTVTGGLGDGTSASTTASDYMVAVLGPIITDTDISNQDGIAFVGEFAYDAGASSSYVKTGSTSYDDQLSQIAPSFRGLIAPGSVGGGGILKSRMVRYTGGTSGAAANVAYGVKVRAHADDDASEQLFRLSDSADSHSVYYTAGGTFNSDADAFFNDVTINGTLEMPLGSTANLLGEVNLGTNGLGPDIDANVPIQMDTNAIKFGTPLTYNIQGLEKVENGGATIFGGPGLSGPTTFDFVFDIDGSTNGTSEVRAGSFVAREGLNYTGGASNGGAFIAEGAEGRYTFEKSGAPLLSLVKRYKPCSTEWMLNETCKAWNLARWTGSAAPTSPGTAYTGSYHQPTTTEPASLSTQPNPGGDGWTFSFDVQFPGGVDIEECIPTWALRYVNNTGAHTGGSDGAAVIRLTRQVRLGLSTSPVDIVPPTSCTNLTGIFAEQVIAITGGFTIEDTGTATAGAQNDRYTVSIALEDSSTRGQTSRISWLKFKLGISQVEQVLY